MMRRTEQEWERLLVAAGVKKSTAHAWAPVFSVTVDEDTFSKDEADLSDFLPQILHESNMLESMKENMNYSAKRIRELGAKSNPGTRWRKAAEIADALAAGGPDAIAEFLYGGRMGNDQPGDGALYIARSPIGITGKDNYKFMSELMGQDFVGLPQLLEQKHFALEACIGWWEGRVPDKILGNTRLVRKAVQGGDFGLEHVVALKAKLLEAGI